MQDIVLVRFGEVFLKGQNRSFFMNALTRNLRAALRDTGAQVELVDSRYLIEGGEVHDVCAKARKVFGVHSLSPAIACAKELDAVYAAAIHCMQGLTGTFKVAARRSDKRFPMDSMELNCEVGGVVLDAYPHLRVDVHHPDHLLEVEIRVPAAYVFVRKIPAVGGMPVGTGGRATLLLSGGIDSPVAGYRIAKRGVLLDCVHFHSFPFTSEQSKQKVIDLATILAGYTGGIRLHIVPFTQIQQELHEHCPDSQLTLLMRRHMMRIADRIAVKRRSGALVTGESLGQVASQTMDSLRCTGEVCTLPIFRPLIGDDKQEIVEVAKQIGTYDTSILPFEDCCTIFTPKHPNTRPHMEKIRHSEDLIDYAPMIERALAETEVLDIRP